MSDVKRLNQCLLFEVMHFPEKVEDFDVRDWEALLRQARQERLLAKLYNHLKKNDCLSNAPIAAQSHMTSAWKVAKKHEQTVQWEVDRVLYALRDIDVNIILLKGAAYLMSDRSCAVGRIYTDIDILVRKANLPDIEKVLMIHGWVQEDLDEYDQHYYRKWTHEIPPLRHRRRNTILDIHHSITPNIFRFSIGYDDLMPNSIEVAPHVRVLSNEDMLLHVIVHLVNEEEFSSGYRDMLDIVSLTKEFSATEGFWGRLLQRAEDTGFELPLYYGLALVQCHGLQKIDHEVIRLLEKRLGFVKWPIRKLVRQMLEKVTLPKDRQCRSVNLIFLEWMLYIRGHYLRMPLYLLLPHLVRKLFIRKEY